MRFTSEDWRDRCERTKHLQHVLFRRPHAASPLVLVRGSSHQQRTPACPVEAGAAVCRQPSIFLMSAASRLLPVEGKKKKEKKTSLFKSCRLWSHWVKDRQDSWRHVTPDWTTGAFHQASDENLILCKQQCFVWHFACWHAEHREDLPSWNRLQNPNVILKK